MTRDSTVRKTQLLLKGMIFCCSVVSDMIGLYEGTQPRTWKAEVTPLGRNDSYAESRRMI